MLSAPGQCSDSQSGRQCARWRVAAWHVEGSVRMGRAVGARELMSNSCATRLVYTEEARGVDVVGQLQVFSLSARGLGR